MKRWRAVLGMKSPLARPLSAERLFGHVCWGLALREGPEAVSDFLARMAGDSPPLVLAEPAPVNFVPMPVLLQDGRIIPDVVGKRLTLWDRYRRAGLMPRAALLKAATDLTAAGVREALDASGWPRPVRPRRDLRIRSATSRFNGAPSGRNDWLAVETWDDRDGGHLEVLIASDLEAAEIERLLRMGLEHGVGRAASAGYGHVELLSVEPLDWLEVTDANAVVTLGPCVPKRSDPAGGAWQVQTQWGRLGGTFATEGIAVEKRPVMGLKAGAVLTGVVEDKAFVGRLVGDVHPARPEVVHYGLAPVLAVRTQD